MDKQLKSPALLEHYQPSEDIIRIRHSKKIIERLIFPEEGPYTEHEEEKYEEFLDYLYELEVELPEVMTKRRTMRFLIGNNYKNKKTYENIFTTIEWRNNIRPIILSKDMKNLLNHGYMYVHGKI